jgi:uncharacterized membrane protein
MRPATVITLAILLLALFAAAIYQLLRLPASDSAETTAAAGRAIVGLVGRA